MEIKINETNEIVTLRIIDENGVNWINDLMGNNGALPEYDGDYYLMPQDDFNHWKNLTSSYQEAYDRYNQLLRELDNDRYEILIESASNINVDLEDYPGALNEICDEFEK